ncbi:hypothetical protein LEN26_009418 [Aphanomyces euteiches]|nr:hypothetical protein LEN26_009418 [Aphanomyces euteiches]KAH9127358.1 hypothetical protein AeMF1_002346 [Aphanomyces euteiches]KAH9191990.1 hypothetical protein AeNC1_006048 [Aphanomyces euteiches]
MHRLQLFSLRHLATRARKPPPELSKADLDRCYDFIQVTKIFREQQAATSDFTIVPVTFKVPPEAPWPESLHGKIQRTSKIRRWYKDGALPDDVVQQLDGLKFVWDVMDHNWNMKVLALSKYKDIYGDTYMPYSYVVPDQDPNWPKDTWNMKLGHVVHFILRDVQSTKRKLTLAMTKPDARQQQLTALGFDWTKPGKLA